MAIKLGDVTTKLLDKLCEIEEQCFEQEALTRQQLAYLIADYNTIGLTAMLNDEIVGFAIARVSIERSITFGHILTIDVAPAHRRIGIAQTILQEIEAILRQRDIEECRLEVREKNVAALNLYKKLGYTKIGRLEKYYGRDHGLYLKKTL